VENEQFDPFSGEGEVGPPPDPLAGERLRLVDNPLVREARFLADCTDHPWKVTLPAISNFYMVQYLGGAYDSPDEYVAHMGQLTAELVGGAVAAGARYIQFDFPLYPALCDPDKRAELESGLGESAASILDKAIAADRALLDAIPAEVTTAMHICRGNFRSRWWATGSLEPVAERMFGELAYDRFLVEWEDAEREGGFDALRNVPTPGPVVVLGIVSSKRAQLESDDAMVRRIDEASSFLDLAQLAISPQCGFASVWHGNEITEDVQWRKLELVGRVAERVWGETPRV
jgi:5-methyltetrahydropteroyltriglutamate--homocysteine methyltransferase